MYKYILKTQVNVTSYEDSSDRVVAWARACRSCYVCAANVHMVMEAYDSHSFKDVLDHADLVTPDGMPLVWGMRLFGVSNQTRVCGPELTLKICSKAASSGIIIGLYGSSAEVLESLKAKLLVRFPLLKIGYSYSPPFRPLTSSEDAQIVNDINNAGVRILFVGLGCPKQEAWMANHKGRINAVMIGVGAAFDFHAGRIKQAPRIMQKLGLEWFFRLCMEPQRLWLRYLKHNPRFLILFLVQYVKYKVHMLPIRR